MLISKLSVSVKAKAILRNSGYFRVEDLKDFTEDDFNKMENMDVATSREIMDAVSECLKNGLQTMTSSTKDIFEDFITDHEKENDEDKIEIVIAEENDNKETSEDITLTNKEVNEDETDDEELDEDDEIYESNSNRFVSTYSNYSNSQVIPFDESVLPIEYKHFSENYVNEANFHELVIELRKIEKKYEQGINYEYRYNINDWESELSYEQGRFIENIEWNGADLNPAFIEIAYSNYSRMNEQQIKYYLYWRTQFRKQNYINNGHRSYYYICAYELLADMGPYNTTERLRQLEQLYINFKTAGLTNISWVKEYATSHKLSLTSDFELNYLHTQQVQVYQDILRYDLEVCQGNYSNVFESMNKKSKWKVKKNPFVIRAKLTDTISDIMSHLMPIVENYFNRKNVKLSDFLVGRPYVAKEERYPFSGSIWNQRVVKRLVEPFHVEYIQQEYPSGAIYITDPEGNIKRRTNTCLHFSDPYLAEYILKYTEMFLREKFEYGHLSWPQKPQIGALKMKFAAGMDYILPVDKEHRDSVKNYLAAFQSLDVIIGEFLSDYYRENEEHLNQLKNTFLSGETCFSNSMNSVSFRNPNLEDVEAFILDNLGKNQMRELIELYSKTTKTTQKTKARQLSSLIWDYWILEGTEVPYSELKEVIFNNKWNYEAKLAITNNDYAAALPFLTQMSDIRYGILSKTYSVEVMTDCLIIAFMAISRIIAFHGLSPEEAFLGEWKCKDWNIFEAGESMHCIYNESKIVNIANLEQYEYDAVKRTGMVEGYIETEKNRNFVSNIVKTLDNSVREILGIKTLLKVDEFYDILSDTKYEMVAPLIKPIIVHVAKYVTYRNKGKQIEITKYKVNRSSTRYVHTMAKEAVETLENKDPDTLVKSVLEEYYSDFDINYKPKEDNTNCIDLEFSNFDFDSYKVLCDKEVVELELNDSNVTRFYNTIYPDLQEKLAYVIEQLNQTNYDPNYSFFPTRVNTVVEGIIGKDLYLLTNLQEGEAEFFQWVRWAENGKFVIPKNEPYIQMLFQLAINRAIFKDEPEKCLVLLSAICNYYFSKKEKIDQAAWLLYEWLKTYWMIYCKEIAYEDFKDLLCLDVRFYNETGRVQAKDHYIVNLDKMNKSNLVDFYNEVCDYKVIHGRLVQAGYRKELENALEKAQTDLEHLWKEYQRDFYKDLKKEDAELVERHRLVFFRGILMEDTIDYIYGFDNIYISDCEQYSIEEDYRRLLPIITYQQYEISNNSGRYLMEYILKKIEMILRYKHGIKGEFKFSDYQLYELYPYELFKDNCSEGIIEETIKNTLLTL